IVCSTSQKGDGGDWHRKGRKLRIHIDALVPSPGLIPMNTGLTTVPLRLTFIRHPSSFPIFGSRNLAICHEVGSGCKTRAAAQLLTRTLPPVTGDSGKADGVGWTLPRPYS